MAIQFMSAYRNSYEDMETVTDPEYTYKKTLREYILQGF